MTTQQVDNFMTKEDLMRSLGINSVNTFKGYCKLWGINTAKREFSEDEVSWIQHARQKINAEGYTVSQYKAEFIDIAETTPQPKGCPTEQDLNVSEQMADFINSADLVKLGDQYAIALADNVIDYAIAKFPQVLVSRFKSRLAGIFNGACGSIEADRQAEAYLLSGRL
jgi:hypothetical protein